MAHHKLYPQKDILTHWGRDEITNVRLFTFKIVYFASSVPLMTWILLHVLAFHPFERLRWSLAWISSLPMGLSSSYLFWWQLMWWVCGRSGLWPFRFVAVPVCGRSGLWPFRLVAVSVCGRSGLWPFRFVAVSVVTVSVCGRYDLLPIKKQRCNQKPEEKIYRMDRLWPWIYFERWNYNVRNGDSCQI